jgi:hypothetical protein
VFSSPEGVATIRRNILSEKALARVKEIATLDGAEPADRSGDAPSRDEPAESSPSEKEDAE